MHDGSHSVTHGRYRQKPCWCCFKRNIPQNVARKYCDRCRILRHKDACWMGMARKERAAILADIESLRQASHNT